MPEYEGHTPGKYHVHVLPKNEFPAVADVHTEGENGHYFIATFFAHEGPTAKVTKEIAIANANFFAAAPNLLAEVERLRGVISKIHALVYDKYASDIAKLLAVMTYIDSIKDKKEATNGD